MTNSNDRRKRVDLRHTPAAFRYALAAAIILIVTGAAWLVGRDQPAPEWIAGQLIPILGVVFALLVVLSVVEGALKWWSRRRKDRNREKR